MELDYGEPIVTASRSNDDNHNGHHFISKVAFNSWLMQLGSKRFLKLVKVL